MPVPSQVPYPARGVGVRRVPVGATGLRVIRAAAELPLTECPADRAERVRPVVQAQRWNRIAERMSSLVNAARTDATSEESA